MFSGDGKYVGAAVDNKVGYFYNLKNGELSLKIDEGKNPSRPNWNIDWDAAQPME